VAYALPLAGLLSGAVLGDLIASSASKELSALLLGLTGLIAGLLLARRLGGALARQPRYQAEILRVVTPLPGDLRCEPGASISCTSTTLEK
jgi:positive regulator of sigma E activity